MCKPASFVITKDRIFWSKRSDSHEEIITEFKLNADGVGGPNIVRAEISPPNGNLSLPLDKWVYQLDQTITPEWYDAITAECECRAELTSWTKQKLSGWNVVEAFNPVNPLLIELKKLSDQILLKLLQDWALVGDAVGAAVADSVADAVGAAVGDAVWESVWDSARDSVRAYTGGLFPNIKKWEYAEKLGSDPWRPLLTLWYAGYVPSFDGTTWRLHAGKDAEVVLEWKPKEDK